ncbi:MAG: hypothetical protein LUC85_02595 [Bacteroidales bacterium]|nr:hypothetical protein [Bacteroidales bacterium]MCD8393707.1 hypothetical protein [Bacteroidales bacterium]
MNEVDSSVYIALLCREVERALGHAICSPADFDEASQSIMDRTHVMLSASTLKRIWGYVASTHSTRSTTLSILAAYAGYRDWEDFRAKADRTLLPDSGFLGGNAFTTSDIPVNTRIALTWAPNRRMVARCVAPGRFLAEEVENASLPQGTQFSCSLMAKGFPLQAFDLEPATTDGQTVYVAGAKGGLTKVELQ